MCLDVIQTSLAKRVILYLFCVWKPFKVQDAKYHVILVWFLLSIGVATGTVTGSCSGSLDSRFGYPYLFAWEDSSKDMQGHFTCKTLTHLKTTLSTGLRKKLTKIPEPATWLYPLMRRYTCTPQLKTKLGEKTSYTLALLPTEDLDLDIGDKQFHKSTPDCCFTTCP